MEEQPFLSLRGVGKQFRDGTEALSDITFSLPEGSFTLLTGANGSGKSVLLKLIGGLISPDVGEIVLQGRPLQEHAGKLYTKAGFIFQDPDSQIVGETVMEDICFGPRNLGLPEAEVLHRAEEALALTGLTGLEEKPPHLLSGGEKRRLAIAGIEVMEPRLMLLDEPFTNLDYPGVVSLLQLLVSFHARGRTIILATHDLAKCAAHAGLMLFLSRGKLHSFGPLEEVLPALPPGEVKIPPGNSSVHEWTWLSSGRG